MHLSVTCKFDVNFKGEREREKREGGGGGEREREGGRERAAKVQKEANVRNK